MNYFDDVGKFHGKFNLPVSHETWPKTGTARPGFLSKREFDFRMKLIYEETQELVEGNSEGDLAKIGDSLVDLVYVVLGTAHYFGLPFDALWKEVQRANMEKRPWREGDPIKPRNTTGLEVVKPEGWQPPDIQGILDEFEDHLPMPQSFQAGSDQ